MSNSKRHNQFSTEDVLIESLSHEGRGVARVNGKTVFVSGALPGESVAVNYIRRKSRFDEAEVLEINQPSPYRVEAACKYFDLCGGCSLQHIHSDYQISHKQAVVLEQLSHIGNVHPQDIIPPVTGNVWGYRFKARLGVKYVANNNKVLVGFRERKNPSFIADIDECLVLHSSIGKRIAEFKLLIDSLSIRSKIPQLEVAIGENESAIIVRHLEKVSTEDIALLDTYSIETGIKIFLQGGDVNSVTTLHGSKPNALDYNLQFEDIKILFSPMDFTQVNPEINQKMVKKVIELLELNKRDTVLDLFCGLGNFTLPIARNSHLVTGIEGARHQVDGAIKNAEVNGITNVEFKCIDLYSDNIDYELFSGGYNKLLLDPPRNGAKEVISSLNMDKIQKLVYVSCNPATLARDAGILVNEKGFMFKMIGVIDMFPHTSHVESIAVFNK